MERFEGYSDFVLIIKDEDMLGLEVSLNLYHTILDKVKQYQIGNENKYWVVQLEMMEATRSCEEMCRFMCDHFRFVAMKQYKSRFIISPDPFEFRAMLQDVYKDRGKEYFLYDMLTISERYTACLYAGFVPGLFDGIRLMHVENGNIYSLVFSETCLGLFSDETELELLDDYTGEIEKIDVLEGLGFYKPEVAILAKKS